ncbi:hypothetical protein E1293_28220 [Actinomadura darangshiensis]|uniref:AMP-dependent synthetase/ligase domain-containing protein n=1 Tax=Actinomadura darangshiensis TaxID=705336 RepID=A0A4R5ATH5_9ACTN|nr:AMP-binding protein [Actinomadura darangshiensis]TDD75665.1 hypothetical protein E1293_28220 [Actinomadura darangshiensis]
MTTDPLAAVLPPDSGGDAPLSGSPHPHGHASLEEIVRPFGTTGQGLTFIGRHSSARLSFAELAARAGTAAHRLRDAGMMPGDPVAMVVTNDLESVTAVLGTWMAGGTVVSLPPAPQRGLELYASTFGRIIASLGCRFLVGAEPGAESGAAVPLPPGGVVLDGRALAAPGDERRPPPDAAIPENALVQFTSGSIGAPKGVVIGRDALAGHLAVIAAAMGLEPEHDRVVSWLPLYHDMGLVAMFLTGLGSRVDISLSSPTVFAGRPASWLTTLSEQRATITAAPDFAYRLAASVPYEEGLDLSRMRVAVAGGERVLWQTLVEFHETAGPLGFAWEALSPSYGLAEGVVGTTCIPPGRGPVRGPGGHTSLGPPMAGMRVRIAPDTGDTDGAASEGAPIHIAGESLFSGYQTGTGFTPREGEWHDTGDSGFVHDGDLYVLGRRAEIITTGGRNVFAEDVEMIAHAAGGDRLRGCAAFRAPGARDRFAMYAEADRATAGSPDEALALARLIRAEVSRTLRTRLTFVRIVRRGTIPRTTSGKVRRAHCRDLYGSDALGRRTVAELA